MSSCLTSSFRPLRTSPQAGKKEFAVQLYWPDEDSGPEESTADWFDVVPTEEIKMDDCGAM